NLARFADEVVILLRGADIRARMSSYLCDRIADSDNIVVRHGCQVTRAVGTDRLEQVRLSSPPGEEKLDAPGMFVFIGGMPHTEWLGQEVATDDHGFILTGPRLKPDRWALERDPFLLETSLPGVFAVGDVRATSVKRVASAVGDGSVAVQFVHQVLGGACPPTPRPDAPSRKTPPAHVRGSACSFAVNRMPKRSRARCQEGERRDQPSGRWSGAARVIRSRGPGPRAPRRAGRPSRRAPALPRPCPGWRGGPGTPGRRHPAPPPRRPGT